MSREGQGIGPAPGSGQANQPAQAGGGPGRQLLVCRPGRVPYDKALQLQQVLQQLRIDQVIDDVLLLLEHPPVLTLGTRGEPSNIYLDQETLDRAGIHIHKVNRGGDVTYHGPGQIVGYPIMDIRDYPGRIRGFVTAIEEAVIQVVSESCGRTAGAGTGKMTGVWVGDAKICAIGLSVRQGVTMHGFAFNVNTDLSHFAWINPCGLSRPVTSVAALNGSPADLDLLMQMTGDRLAKALGCTAVELSGEQVWQMAGLEPPERQPSVASQADRADQAGQTGEKTARPYLRKPEWLRVRPNLGRSNAAVQAMLRELNLHTVCEAAQCPNCGECFGRKVATFLILGDQCTRSCRFCSVSKNCPQPLDPDEPDHVAQACERLGLRHVVITSVTRDDLPDGGAGHFAKTIRAIRDRLGQAAPLVEVLIPDFAGRPESLALVTAARPAIINHNVETVPRLYASIRPEADYTRSISLLRQVKLLDPGIVTKSGLMAGLGETEDEVLAVLSDLRQAGCDMLTIGQYLAPSRQHAPVVAYIEPARFDWYADQARRMGFKSVASGPLVRSSYQAEHFYEDMAAAGQPQA